MFTNKDKLHSQPTHTFYFIKKNDAVKYLPIFLIVLLFISQGLNAQKCPSIQANNFDFFSTDSKGKILKASRGRLDLDRLDILRICFDVQDSTLSVKEDSKLVVFLFNSLEEVYTIKGSGKN